MEKPMSFGELIRKLRKARNLSQRELADKVKLNFTYLSKIENEKLDFAQFPSVETIEKLARALGANESELLLLAQKIPEDIKRQVIKRPDVFRKIASLDDRGFEDLDKTIDKLLRGMEPCDEDNRGSSGTKSSKK
jgi:transcriptional regulator with XRE-family HTH domain